MGDSWIVWKQSKNLGRYMFFSPFSPTCFSFFGYTYDWQQKEFFYQNVTRFKQWFGKGERLQPQPNIKHHEEKVIHWILWDYQKECTLNCYHLMQQSELKPTISNLTVWTKLWGKKRPVLVNWKGVMVNAWSSHSKNHVTKDRKTWLEENSSSTLFSRYLYIQLFYLLLPIQPVI